MPKSNLTSSPTGNNKAGSDDSTSRMSDVALRKKKNADAQAAFRARRANYIATLEETVTSLESVVLQLQDSCREARNESQELRQENARLRHESREREKFWKALWQTKKAGQSSEPDDLPPLPASFPSAHSQNGMGPLHLPQYGSGSLGYRINDDPSTCNGPYNAGPGHNYQNHSPSISYAGVEADISSDSASHALSQRGPKYSPYTYPVHGVARGAQWPQTIAQSASSGGGSGVTGASNHSSHSPGFVESPNLTSSEMAFVSRFPVEEQKAPLSNLDTAPYVFPSSRSLSPSSTPGSSSSNSMSSFQFTFPDSVVHDSSNFDYRRHSHPHGAEVVLHGGTADISLVGPTHDGVRYRLGARQTNSSSDRPLLPALPPLSGSENGSQHERGSSDGDSTPYPHTRLRPRRDTAPSRSSRSPSPGAPTLSGTLAVIKAQSFGSLRRTRTRAKKTSMGAAKVVMGVLEARGIGMGVSTGSKRPRLHDDDLDMSQT